MDRAEPRLVLGTAGHIDHGKTALIGALTGVDTDRLPEEKARGITIELGFAPLDLPDGTRLGVVDVPGHEGLVRTMVAGATGIDLLLLVVAADEGVMPQTREHLAICELLGITRAVVALTKIDATDEEMAELAAEEVAELIETTALRGSPILGVSAHSGAGIDELREALVARARETSARTSRRGPPRLAVDRSFEVRGFGSVATGTLVGGGLAVGDTVEVYPSGLTSRVRGLQSHGDKADAVEPGARVAINLQNVSLDELSRGLVISKPGALAPTTTLDAQIDWLATASPVDEPTSVSFLAGTVERRARVAPIGASALLPGGSGFGRIHIDGDPVVLLPGDRFILRGFARTDLGATLGGGVVLDVDPPHRRRTDPLLAQELAELTRRDPKIDVAVRVRRSGLAGVSSAAVRRETGLAKPDFDAAVEALRSEGEVVQAGDQLLHGDSIRRLEKSLAESVDAYHAAEPLRPGMSMGALRGTLPDNVPAPATERAIARLTQEGAYVVEGDHVRRADHRPTLDPASEAVCEKIGTTLREASLETPSLRDLGSQLGLDDAKLRDLLAHLERSHAIVRAPGDLWFDAAEVEALRERVRRHFEGNDDLDTRTYKTLIGTTRRTAVPLMELLDDEHLTVRRGEVRKRGRAQ